MSPRVVIAHDFLTQRGGAERVVLAMHRAFPDAAVVTAAYDPDGTYPAFAEVDVRTLPIGRLSLFRNDHRKAFPLLPAAWSSARVDADVVLCSSAGWAHGVRTGAPRLVYCYTPPRWLYRFADVSDDIGRFTRRAAHLVAPAYRAWDRQAARSATRYLGISTEVCRRIRSVYGIEPGLLFPPTTLDVTGPCEPVAGVEPGHVLTVSRLLAYKNVEAIVAAFRRLPGERLVVAGSGPLHERLAASAPANVTFVGAVSDEQLRWLLAQCRLVVAAGFEDFGLTPIEAAAAGRPTVAIRWGGHLDTVDEGVTGVFAAEPTEASLAAAIAEALARPWDGSRLRSHAAEFGVDRFVAALRSEVEAVVRRKERVP